jgi:drug/metabolite transporter (DMT)-like permease
MQDKEHHGLLFATLAAVCTAFIALLVRFTEPLPVTTMLFARFFIAALIVLPSIIQKKVVFTKESLKDHAPRIFWGCIGTFCFYYSITKLHVIDAVTLWNTGPLFLPLIIFLWIKHIIPLMRVLAVIIGFLGVVIVLRPSPLIPLYPALLGLLGGFSMAMIQLLIRRSLLTSLWFRLSYFSFR